MLAYMGSVTYDVDFGLVVPPNCGIYIRVSLGGRVGEASLAGLLELILVDLTRLWTRVTLLLGRSGGAPIEMVTFCEGTAGRWGVPPLILI